MIPQSLSRDTDHQRGTSLTVNPAKPQQLAGSSFNRNPSEGPDAPIFVSDNGGKTWMLNSIIPAVRRPGVTGGISLCFSPSTNNLYATAVLDYPRPYPTTVDILRTDNFMSSDPMTILSRKQNVDQPFINPTTAAPNDSREDRLHIGINDFNNSSRTATIGVIPDATVGSPVMKSIIIEKRDAKFDGPPIRTAIHSDGTSYAAFLSHVSAQEAGTNEFGGKDMNLTSNVVVVRDDNYGMGSSEPFSALCDPDDAKSGLRIVSNIMIPWRNWRYFGQERIIGDLSIAVNPTDSSNVFIAWADQQNNCYTLHVRNSSDRGLTWSKDLRQIPNAKSPGLAINNQKKVGFLYQQLSSDNRWNTHFELSSDGFVTMVDYLLATVPSTVPKNDGWLPYYGDYNQLVTTDRTFYGIFSTNNTPDLGNFPSGVTYQRLADFNNRRLLDSHGKEVVPSIDPFFFKVT